MGSEVDRSMALARIFNEHAMLGQFDLQTHYTSGETPSEYRVGWTVGSGDLPTQAVKYNATLDALREAGWLITQTDFQVSATLRRESRTDTELFWGPVMARANVAWAAT